MLHAGLNGRREGKGSLRGDLMAYRALIVTKDGTGFSRIKITCWKLTFIATTAIYQLRWEMRGGNKGAEPLPGPPIPGREHAAAALPAWRRRFGLRIPGLFKCNPRLWFGLRQALPGMGFMDWDKPILLFDMSRSPHSAWTKTWLRLGDHRFDPFTQWPRVTRGIR